ncbi:MAG: hypothetical protein QM675_10745 [Protaetiibacter sp.]
MPSDPIEIDRARDRLAELSALHRAAQARAAHPPRLEPEDWRGPAFEAYAWWADELAARMRDAAEELGRAVVAARVELSRALG